VPDEWSVAVVCPVFKKRSGKECDKYRGKIFLNTAYKMYEKI
jgi:hypothetical protein